MEVWVRDTSDIKGYLGKRICNQLSKVGFKNRGVNITAGLWVLNKTSKPALLIEVCFVSDPDDAKLYKANRDKVAKAIVQAILNYNKVH